MLPRQRSVAIIGGGISGLATAYYLEKARRADSPLSYKLFEWSGKLGGIVQSESNAGFVIEAGADSWVNQKPWAKELALELGLQDEIMPSLDQQRRTYILSESCLVPMPRGMKLMVPADLQAMLSSEIFAPETKARVLREQDMQPGGPDEDESVSSFVERHFGQELVEKIAEPMLAGIYGGDASRLSARAVLPGLVALERQYGSLIRGTKETTAKTASADSVFVSLRGGMHGLADAVAGQLLPSAVVLNTKVLAVSRIGDGWTLATPAGQSVFDELVLAVPAGVAAKLLAGIDGQLASLLELRYSSCNVVALGFEPEQARKINLPPGFGFLVPRGESSLLMACTFIHQKFASRAPEGCALLRAFIGEPACNSVTGESDETISRQVLRELRRILNFDAEPAISRVQRWPNSMPQYEVGHLERVAKIASQMAKLSGLRLVGNGYHGIGIPDCVRGGKIAADAIVAAIKQQA